MDTALAVALTLDERGRCEGCGHPTSETMHRDNEFAYQVEVVRCHSCATRDRHIEGMPKESSTAGIRFVTKRKDDAE